MKTTFYAPPLLVSLAASSISSAFVSSWSKLLSKELESSA